MPFTNPLIRHLTTFADKLQLYPEDVFDIDLMDYIKEKYESVYPLD